MQPYQKASEALRSGEEYPLNLLKNAGLTALGGGAAAAGSKALSKIAPAIGALINEFVPEKLSRSGLNKIDSRFGNFIDGAMKEGYSFDEIRNFIGERVKKSQQQENPKTNTNIIEQYSPDLHQFILGEIQSGKSPIEAAALASLDRKGKSFKKVIDQIVKDHNSPWSAIIETVYGSQKSANQQNQTQQQQPSQGSGQQALMDILNKINQRLGQ